MSTTSKLICDVFRAGHAVGMERGRAEAASSSPRDIAIERDIEGLQTALREIFEESYIAGANGAIYQSTDREAIERAEEDTPARSLSPGYYSRAAYLLDLASAIEAGVSFAPSFLTRVEVQGLEAVRRAKAAFESDHPSCPGCTRRLDNRHMVQCPHCKTKFAGRGN